MVKALINNQFVRYVIASAIALCVDYGSYLVIAKTTNITLPTAAAMGYSVGLIAAYFLIAGPVFKDGWLRKKKLFESGLFLVSGLLGVTLTFLTVYLYVSAFGERLHSSKLIAITVSFVGVYLFRKYVVFRQSTAKAS
jgi:putative flippase GtrA